MKKIGWLFVAPALIHLIVFAGIPILYAAYISLFDWRILRDEMPFVGLGQYVDVMRDTRFWQAMWNSVRFVILSVPAGTIVALLVALLVAQKLRGMAFFRTLFYIPAISSGVAIAMLWTYVYLPETGLINTFLAFFGRESIDFLNEKGWAMPALAFMAVWTGLGPKMVIYVAGIMGISPSLYEAADLDGASSIRKFFSVTVPMLAPTTLFVLVTGTIGAFQLFTPIYMMTQGRPEDTTNVIGYHIYTEAWRRFQVSTAAAQSFVLLLAIAIVAYAQYRGMKRQLEGYSAG